MKRMWPEEFNFVFNHAEEVTLDLASAANPDTQAQGGTGRRALKARLSQEDYERIWPLAEARYRLGGQHSGKAITLIANNPHYHEWHPADGGVEDTQSANGTHHKTSYVVVHFLLDDVSVEGIAA